MPSLDDIEKPTFTPQQLRPPVAEQPSAFSITKLAPDEEASFLKAMGAGDYKTWADTFQQRFGEAPNLNDPQYDYRAAWKAGITPQPYAPDQNFLHWPSALPSGQMLKAPDHPTAWMEHFMQQYGVDPNSAPDAVINEAKQSGLAPQDWQKQQPPTPGQGSGPSPFDDLLRIDPVTVLKLLLSSGFNQGENLAAGLTTSITDAILGPFPQKVKQD
jgi:hypothetical protein